MSDQARFSDEDLTAILDGEADADLLRNVQAAIELDETMRDRIQGLTFPQDALAAAFQQQLAAAPPPPELPMMEAIPPQKRNWGLFAGGLGSGLAAGFALAFAMGFGTPAPTEPGWLDAVANYQVLYVPETLASEQTPSPTLQSAQLQALSDVIGLNLVALHGVDGMQFQRGQQLGFKGKPLIQLAYLLPDGTPVAICVLESGKPSSAMKSREIEGLAAVHWNTGQHEVLVIGGQDQSVLNAIVPSVQANI